MRPANVSSAPRAARPSAVPDAPATVSATPAAAVSRPAIARRPDDVVPVVAVSRIAARGGTRDARTAGTTLAGMVTSTPTANASTSRDASTVSDDAGSPSPPATSRDRSPAASPVPTTSPQRDARPPISNPCSAEPVST